MSPKEVLEQWIIYFNNADAENISNLYAENATNHQVANKPVVGKTAIYEMFRSEFANAKWFVFQKIFLKIKIGSF